MRFVSTTSDKIRPKSLLLQRTYLVVRLTGCGLNVDDIPIIDGGMN